MNRHTKEKKPEKGLISRMKVVVAGFFVAVFFLISSTPLFATAGVPQLINFQGRLLDNSGNLLGGPSGTDYCFKFSIYDATTGGSKIWPSGSPTPGTLSVREGVFDGTIGAADTLDLTFTDDQAYVNVAVSAKSGTCDVGETGESYETLSPRPRIVSSAFALNSKTVGGFTPAQSATDSQIPVLTSGALVLGHATTAGLKATGSNALTFQSGVTGDINFFSTSNKITSSGALTIAGLMTSTGLTTSGAAVSINNNSNFTTDINTGSSNTLVSIGGGSGTFALNTTNIDISSAGAITGATGVTSSGTITFSGLGGTGTRCLQTDNTGIVSVAGAACGTGSIAWDAITAPSGNLSLAHGANTTAFTFNSLTTGTAFALSSSSLSSGTLLDLTSTGTAALTGQKGLNIALSGANGTGAQTTYGAYLSNTKTGTSVNVGLFAEATGGSTNYAAQFNGDVNFTNAANRIISITNTSGAAGKSLAINSGSSATGGFAGGGLSLTAGFGSGSALGGAINITSGAGGQGGNINIVAGDGTPTDGDGGSVYINPGNSSGGPVDGNVIIANANGNVSIGSTTATSLFNVGSSAQFQVNSSGDILTPAAENLSITTGTTGILTLDSGTTGTVNLGTGNNAKTINIATGTAGNTINIGTNNTTLDAINIGSALDTVTVTGNSSSAFVLNAVNVSATEFNVLDAGIERGDLTTQGTATDEFCLTSEAGGGALLEWQACGGGAVAWNAITAPTGNLTLAMDADTTTFNYDTLTTETGFTLGSTSITTGRLFSLTSSSTALTSGGLFDVTHSGVPAGSWTGDLAKIESTGASTANLDGNLLKLGYTGTAGASDGTVLNVTTTQTGTSALALRVNDDGTYTDSTPFVVDAAGEVGIGTNAPSAKLHIKSTGGVNSGINLEATSASSYGTIDFNTDAGLAGQFLATGSSYSNQIFTGNVTSLANYISTGSVQLVSGGASGIIQFATGGIGTANERMRIGSSGNVTIGSTTLTSLFNVGSSAQFQVNSSGDILTPAAEALSITTGTTGALTLDSGTTGTVNLGTGNNAKTINIATGTAGNTINIGTDNTTLDTISIGSALDTVTVTGNASSAFVLNAVNVSATEFNVLDAGIERGDLTTQGTATDEYCLTSETGGGALMEWQACGTGTVTNTGGSLTANAVVLGAGTTDTKVVAGITTDGTAQLVLGVNATTIGTLKLFGNTSGDVTLQPTAAAGTATTQTLPATSGTLVNRVTTANGVSASNSDGALSFTLGAITPSTTNGLTITANGTNTLNIAAGKTLTVNNSITLAGTDSTTMTFPSTSASIARTDAGQTFTGVNTFTSPRIITDISDTNGNELLKLVATGSAVNELTLTNAAATGIVTLAATGADTDVEFAIDSKGADNLSLNGTATGNILLGGGSASTGCTVTNSTGAFACTAAITGSNISGTNTGDVTLTTIGAVPNANGASLSGQQLQLQPADGSFGGVVTTTTQTFAGAKTFSGTITSGTSGTTGADLAITNTGVYTGTGVFNLTANSATTGTIGLITGNGMTTGSLLSLTSSSAAATTGQKGLNVALTGALTGAQTTYGGYFSNTRTGASAVNVGLYATASGATGGNYAAIFEAGNVGVGTTAPTGKLHVADTSGTSTANILQVVGTGVAGGGAAGQAIILTAGTAISATGGVGGGVTITGGGGSTLNDGAGGNITINGGAGGGVGAAGKIILANSQGNVTVGSTTATSLFNIGSSAQFQINTSGDVVTPATEDLSITTGTTGILTLDSGTTGTVNLGTGNNAKTINVGTGTAGNTINIGTDNTTLDTITIGSALDTTNINGKTTLTAQALSYLDLGLVVHNTTANQGLRLPNAASATPSNPTSGEGYLAWDAAGNQLITYNGSSWSTVGGGAPAWNSITAPTGNLTLAMDADTTTFNYDTLTTETGFTLGSTSMTTGKLLNLSHTTSVIANGGSLLNLSSTGVDTSTTTGVLANFSSTASTAGTQFLQTYSGLSTGIGQSIVANALTTGEALNIAHSTSVITDGGSVMRISSSGANTATSSGSLVYFSSSNSATGNQFMQDYTGLTSGIGESITIYGGGLTTGGATSVSGAYAHTAAETGSMSKISFSDNTSAAFDTTTNGLLITPSINTSGSNARTFNGISITPTLTACGTTGGTCTLNNYNSTLPARTQSTTNTLNINGFNIASAGALVQDTAAGTINWTGANIQMPNITQTTGTVTSTGIKITGGTVSSGTAYALTTSATAGNVGIGTTAPINLLDVVNGTQSTGTAGSGANPGAFGMTSADIAMTSNGAQAFLSSNSAWGIDKGGSIGFGGLYGAGTPTNDMTFAKIKGAKETSGAGNMGGYMAFATYNHNLGAIGERMRIDSAGNVGIGDTSPDDLLNVHSATAASGIAITSLGTDTDAYLKFELVDGTASFTMGVDDSDADKFKISTTGLGTSDRFVIDGSGNTTIGVLDTDLTAPTTSGTTRCVITDANGQLSFTTCGGATTWNAITDPTASQSLTFDAGEETVWTKTATAAATEEGLDFSFTAGAGNGSDIYSVLRLNVTSANHTSTGNKVYGINIANLGSADADGEETAVRVGTGWDYAGIYESGRMLLGVASETASSSKLYIENTLTTETGATTAVAGIHENLTFDSDSGTNTQVGNRLVVTNTGSAANTAVGQIVRMINNTSALADTIRGIEIVASAGSNTTGGVNTGIRTTGGTFGIEAITTGANGAVSLPAAIFGQNTAATQGDVLRLYSASMTTAPQMAYFYHETSAFSGDGLVMDFAATGGGTSFSGNFIDLQNANDSRFKVDSTGQVTLTLDGTASTSAVCGSHAGGTGGDQADIMLRDCSGSPAADYAEMYPVVEGIEYGDIVATGSEMVKTYDITNGNIDWTKEKGDITRLVKSTRPYQGSMIGIVSDNYGDFSSTGYNIKEEDRPMPIALNGRVPVKVASDSEPILPGDYLTTSSEPGKAMKATEAGPVIAKALAPWSPESGEQTVMVFVQQGYYNGAYLSEISTTGLSMESLSGSALLTAFLQQIATEQGEEETLFTDRLGAGVEVVTPSLIADTANVGKITATEITAGKIVGIETIVGNLSFVTEGQATLTLTRAALEALSSTVSQQASLIAGLESMLASLQATSDAWGARLDTIETTLGANAFDALTSVATESLTVSGESTYAGRTMFDGLSFFSSATEFTGTVSFVDQVGFKVPPLFNKDTAGFALIKEGGKRVRIEFDNEYAATPVVSAEIAFDKIELEEGAATGEDTVTFDDADIATFFGLDVRHLIVEKDETGFTIILNKPAPRDIPFSWIALAVDDPHIFESLIEGLTIDIQEPPADPSPAESPSPSTPQAESGEATPSPEEIGDTVETIVGDSTTNVEEVPQPEAAGDTVESIIQESEPVVEVAPPAVQEEAPAPDPAPEPSAAPLEF